MRALRSLVLTVALGWVLTACAVFQSGPGPVNPAAYDHPVRVACVGDSITFGDTIRDHQHDTYPAQLGAMLGSGWDVRNFGNSGSTLLKNGDKPYWKQREFTASHDFNPDVVIIMLGTNDTKPQNWGPHSGEFISDYNDLIDSYEKLPAHPKIWISRPVPAFEGGNWGITNRVLTEGVIPKVNQIAAERPEIGMIDYYAALDGHGDLFRDHIHPNAEGAGLMAKAAYKTLTGHAYEGATATAGSASR